jgi:hypothetical protein
MPGEILMGGDIAPGQGTLDQKHLDDVEKGSKGKHRFPKADVVLVVLVSTINSMGVGEDGRPASISMTVTVPGGVVSGQLVPYDWWMAENVRRVTEANEGFGAGLQGIVDGLKEEQDDDALPAFLHLRNVRYYVDDTIPSGAEALWRGRMDQVSGWSFGSIGTSAD